MVVLCRNSIPLKYRLFRECGVDGEPDRFVGILRRIGISARSKIQIQFDSVAQMNRLVSGGGTGSRVLDFNGKPQFIRRP